MRKTRGPTRRNLTEKELEDRQKTTEKARAKTQALIAKGICIRCRENPVPKDATNHSYCAECYKAIIKRRREIYWSDRMAKDLGFSPEMSERAQRMIDERINPTFIGKAPLSKKMMSETAFKCRIVWGNAIPDVEEQLNKILERGITADVIDIKFFETKGVFVGCAIIKEYCGVKSKI